MADILEFKRRDVPKPSSAIDCRRWNCGNCRATVWHLWQDGIIACAICGTLAKGLTSQYVEQ